MFCALDHGGGAIGGFGSDEVHDDYTLTLPKLRTALAAHTPGLGKNWNWSVFDACLMANTETAFNNRELRPLPAASRRTGSLERGGTIPRYFAI